MLNNSKNFQEFYHEKIGIRLLVICHRIRLHIDDSSNNENFFDQLLEILDIALIQIRDLFQIFE
jgi:hypothetical protein